MSETIQACTFRVAGFYCGIPISAVQEVIQSVSFTRAPLARGAVIGLVAVRGDVLTVIDLRRKLHLGAAPPDADPVNLIVRSGGEAISLWVDAIEDVIELDHESGAIPPDTLNPEVRAVIGKVYEIGDRLLLLLDPERVTDVEATVG